MNKLLLTFALISASLTSFSQTQITNGNFENWSKTPVCEMDSLDHFLSGVSFFYSNHLASGDIEFCPDGVSTLKSTDKQSGDYALKLEALNYSGNYYYNFLSLGTGIYSTEDDGGWVSEGIPFTGRPTKLTGYYKFAKGTETDVLSIEVFGANATNEDFLFHGKFIESSNQSTYKKFELILDYPTTDQTNPSVLYMLIVAGDEEIGYSEPGMYALIDNLTFEYGTPTSTTNYSSSNTIYVFAANKTINFSENVSDVHVVDMIGAEKINQSNTTKVLHAPLLNSGMYIVTYKYMDNYFSKKVVIE